MNSTPSASLAPASETRHPSEMGIGLVGLVLSVALSAMAIILGMSVISHSLKAERFTFDNAAASEDMALLFRYLHLTFQRRTQIDVETGVGLYDAVDYLDAANPTYGGFSIQARSSQDLAQISTYRFENICETVGNTVSVPHPEMEFPGLPVCSPPRRWLIQVVSSAQPTRRFLIGNGKHGALSAVFKVRSVSNDNVSLLVGTAKLSLKGQIHWQVRDLEIWDEMPRQGVEFLQ